MGKTKLSNEDVRQIKREIREGHTDAEIATGFPVSRSYVNHIRNGRARGARKSYAQSRDRVVTKPTEKVAKSFEVMGTDPSGEVAVVSYDDRKGWQKLPSPDAFKARLKAAVDLLKGSNCPYAKAALSLLSS